MKILKKISIMFIYPVLLLGTGFLGGVAFVNYFYPGMIVSGQGSQAEEQKWQQISGEVGESVNEAGSNADSRTLEAAEGEKQLTDGELSGNISTLNDDTDQQPAEMSRDASENSVQTSIIREKLNADTSYVLEETDIRNDSVVETVWKLPAKYIGMNREEFVEAMELYEASPPLEELERGFVSLEVLSFSPQKVVVQMNYEYAQPGGSFYLMVVDNYVVVYQEDMETVYMDTDILLTELPEELQQEIIQVMFIPDEESLYNFLENYSS